MHQFNGIPRFLRPEDGVCQINDLTADKFLIGMNIIVCDRPAASKLFKETVDDRIGFWLCLLIQKAREQNILDLNGTLQINKIYSETTTHVPK